MTRYFRFTGSKNLYLVRLIDITDISVISMPLMVIDIKPKTKPSNLWLGLARTNPSRPSQATLAEVCYG